MQSSIEYILILFGFSVVTLFILWFLAIAPKLPLHPVRVRIATIAVNIALAIGLLPFIYLIMAITTWGNAKDIFNSDHSFIIVMLPALVAALALLIFWLVFAFTFFIKRVLPAYDQPRTLSVIRKTLATILVGLIILVTAGVCILLVRFFIVKNTLTSPKTSSEMLRNLYENPPHWLVFNEYEFYWGLGGLVNNPNTPPDVLQKIWLAEQPNMSCLRLEGFFNPERDNRWSKRVIDADYLAAKAWDNYKKNGCSGATYEKPRPQKKGNGVDIFTVPLGR